MVLIVKMFAILFIVYGCLLILRPEILKKITGNLKEGNKVYIACGIKALLGILLILATPQCRIPWVVLFMGSLYLYGSIVALVLKKSVLLDLIIWWESCEQKFLYMAGAGSLVLGALLAVAA